MIFRQTKHKKGLLRVFEKDKLDWSCSLVADLRGHMMAYLAGYRLNRLMGEFRKQMMTKQALSRK